MKQSLFHKNQTNRSILPRNNQKSPNILLKNPNIRNNTSKTELRRNELQKFFRERRDETTETKYAPHSVGKWSELSGLRRQILKGMRGRKNQKAMRWRTPQRQQIYQSSHWAASRQHFSHSLFVHTLKNRSWIAKKKIFEPKKVILHYFSLINGSNPTSLTISFLNYPTYFLRLLPFLKTDQMSHFMRCQNFNGG